jgi:hypothetical protein
MGRRQGKAGRKLDARRKIVIAGAVIAEARDGIPRPE